MYAFSLLCILFVFRYIVVDSDDMCNRRAFEGLGVRVVVDRC